MFEPERGDTVRSIRLRGSARTNTGKVRDNNEDSISLWAATDNHAVLAIVADGMGGAAAGEEASHIAVETIKAGLVNAEHPAESYELLDEDIITDRMKQAIRAANQQIVEKSGTNPDYKGMGTTVTMALVRNSNAIIGHVGDSRAYLVDGRDGHIIQITSDHSFVQALIAAGHISTQEAEEHPMRNVLYRALGQSTDIEIDIYYERLQVNDRLILCSDGLTLHIKPEEIAQHALASGSPEDISRKLIDLANQRGGRDNVSVIVIKVEEDYSDIQALMTGTFEDEDTIVIKKDGLPPSFGSSESRKLPPQQEPNTSAPSPAADDLDAPTLTPGLKPQPVEDTLGEGQDTRLPET